MRVLYLLVCAALILFPAVGCGGESGTEDASSEGAAAQGGGSVTEKIGEAVEEAAGDAAEQAGKQAGAALEQYKSETLAKLAEYEDGLSSLKEAIAALDSEELTQQAEAIQEKLTDARSSADALKGESLADLDAHKSQLDSKLGDIKGDLYKAREKIAELRAKVPKIPG